MKRLKRAVPRLLVLARWLLLVVVIGFAAYYLVSQWPAVETVLLTISPLSLVVSFGAVMAGLVAGTMSWVTLLNGIGRRVPLLRAAQVMLVGQLGKYVPGSVWAYVLQMELGRQYGILRPRVLVASLYAAGIGVVSSLALGALALPVVLQGHWELLWLFALLPVGIACLHPAIMTRLASLVLRLFRRPPLDHRVSTSVVASAVGWSLLSYVCYGVHLWILVNSVKDPDFGTLILLTGAVALGFTIGLIAFVFPSGFGVREAVLIGAMLMVLSLAEATAVSVVSRLLFTVGDLLAAGLAVLLAVAARRSLKSADSMDQTAGREASASALGSDIMDARGEQLEQPSRADRRI